MINDLKKIQQVNKLGSDLRRGGAISLIGLLGMICVKIFVRQYFDRSLNDRSQLFRELKEEHSKQKESIKALK